MNKRIPGCICVAFRINWHQNKPHCCSRMWCLLLMFYSYEISTATGLEIILKAKMTFSMAFSVAFSICTWVKILLVMRLCKADAAVLFFARFWLMLEYSVAETIDRRVRLHSTSFRYFTVISDVNNKNFIKNCITDASSNLESLIVLSQLTIE